MESILTSIKKLLGIEEDYEHFDPDIVMIINSVFSVLHQIGVGPEKGYIITGKENVWSEFLGDGTSLELIKTYMFIKTKLIFDPPSSTSILEAYNKLAAELEWRIQNNHYISKEENTDER